MISRKVKDMNQQHTSTVTSAVRQRRDKRRLPQVQRSGRSRPLTFWPTRRGAAEWLRRNHGSLDTALGLLEIYPTLIQEKSMDVLWEFVSPFIALAQNRDSVRNRRGHHSVRSTPSQSRSGTASRSSGTQRTTTTSCSSLSSDGVDKASTHNSDSNNTIQTSEEHLPLISITFPNDEPEPELQALFEEEDNPQADGPPCIYVCCLCNNRSEDDSCDRLRRNVIHALEHEFYIRSGPCASDTHGVCQDDLTQTGVCVFVLDESSLNTPACLNRLYASWTLNIRTVFVKDGNYCLPSPLPDAILRHIVALESSDMLPVSSTTGIPIARSATPKCGLNVPASRNSSSTSSKKHDNKQDVQESDIILYLLNGYRTALIFEEAKLEFCENMLRERVHSLLDPSPNGSGSSSASSNSSLCSFPGDGGSAQHRDQNSEMMLSAQQDGQPKTDSKLSGNKHKKYDMENSWNSSSKSSVSATTISSNTYLSTNHLLPVPYFQNTSASRLRSPPPVKNILSSSKASLPSVKSSSKRRLLSASSSHLSQVQEQVPARFPLNTSTIFDAEKSEDKSEGLNTTYLLFTKPRHSQDKEPCVVTWLPSGREKKNQTKQEDTLSESYTDSPVSLKNFRDLDLSVEVNNYSNDIDTSDSDSSVLF